MMSALTIVLFVIAIALTSYVVAWCIVGIDIALTNRRNRR
jgi:hypothetical protein